MLANPAALSLLVAIASFASVAYRLGYDRGLFVGGWEGWDFNVDCQLEEEAERQAEIAACNADLNADYD